MSDTTELVDLAVIFPDLEIELKYACADNITGKAIYQQARCLLHKDAITALAKSISIAQLSGLQLVIYDAYRPQQAQAMLWQACPDPQYVAECDNDWWRFCRYLQRMVALRITPGSELPSAR